MTEKIIFNGDGEGNGNVLSAVCSMIPGLMQGNQVNPALLAALQNGNKNQDMFGGAGCWWMWIILLFLFGGNGFGFGGGFNRGLPAELNNPAATELLKAGIQGNGQAIAQLAQTFNCSFSQLQQTLCAFQGAMDRWGASIERAISDCCCRTNENITKFSYESRLATAEQTTTLVETMNRNNATIIAKLDEAEKRGLYDKIDALREQKTVLQNQLSQEHQTAAIQASQAQMLHPVTAALADLSTRLASIECKQPPTVSLPYVPAMGSFIPVNYGLNVGVGTYNGGCGC